jgi:hypothetical protein
MDTITQLLNDVPLPKMVKVIQHFDNSCLKDIAKELRAQLARPVINSKVCRGMRIALTCGSRGIDNYPLILKELVHFCKDQGAEPFIVPAMGSHGGATAEGQRFVCEKMGVSEEYCGCPIKASMEVVEIGKTEEGHPVCIDRIASESDGIIIANRVKSHTSFRGDYESGLMKIMTIGLGKQHGASVCHGAGYAHMARLVSMIGNVILQKAPILFGVGLVENAYDKTYKLSVLTKEEIPKEEPKLLKIAKDLLPRLLPGRSDVLLVDWMGKNISGGGMDANITGRLSNPHAGEPRFKAGKLAVLDITPESHGNIHGVGYADVINRRIFEKGNLDITYPNAITSTTLQADKIPIMMKNDRETIQCAVKTCNVADFQNIWVIHIKDTLHIAEIWVSKNMINSLLKIENLEVTDETADWRFRADGNLW